jgi:hypothetical protein
MKMITALPWLLIAAGLIAPALSTHAATRLLPFQGRLTDANGAVIADGARVVQFKVYDAPVGGRAVWNGEVQKLTVNGGLVSTILGTKAALSSVDFNQDLYLEITIDANADNQITLSDPPLLPRQSILPAVFAFEAGNARALDGYNWTSLFGTNNPAEGTLLLAKIADGSLTTAKIQDGAISSAKIANGAVLRTKLDTTGAAAGQSLTFNGTNVVWNQVNAVNADTLDGFDWSSIFGGGNPQSGGLNVASVSSRGDLTVSGRTYLNGPGTTVQGGLLAVSITSSTDITAFRDVYGRSFIPTSDRNAKENFIDVDSGDVLAKVVDLPITRWNFKGDEAQHIGPVAQDFRAAFGLGVNDKTIATVDADGVALAAIQGLNRKVEQQDGELRTLVKQQQAQIEALRVELDALKASRSRH